MYTVPGSPWGAPTACQATSPFGGPLVAPASGFGALVPRIS